MAKRAGRVGFGSGQSGLQVKRVAGQNMSFLNGLIGSRASRVKQVFFFFFGNICNLSIVYVFLNCDKILTSDIVTIYQLPLNT